MIKPFQPVLIAIITSLLFIAVGYTACISDKCNKINCINGGGCNKGVCLCPTGYEGTYCEIKSDPCKNVICQNSGSCADGKCDCLVGYEGTYCEQLTRDKIIGVYTGTSDCSSSPSSITITAGTSDLTLILYGDNGMFSNQTATVTSKTTFTFSFPSSQYYVVSGTGTLTGDGITITSTITGGVSGPSGNPAITTCVFQGKK